MCALEFVPSDDVVQQFTAQRRATTAFVKGTPSKGTTAFSDCEVPTLFNMFFAVLRRIAGLINSKTLTLGFRWVITSTSFISIISFYKHRLACVKINVGKLHASIYADLEEPKTEYAETETTLRHLGLEKKHRSKTREERKNNIYATVFTYVGNVASNDIISYIKPRGLQVQV